MSDAPTSSPASDLDELAPVLARAIAAFPRSGFLMKAWLESYERTENHTLSCKDVGITRQTVNTWKKNEDFLKVFTATHLHAQHKNNDNLKASTLQLSINGNAHPLIRAGQIVRDDKGSPVVAYREFYPQLNMFLLKNRMPDEFRDKFEHEISGQLIVTLASEFLAIVKRHAAPEAVTSIQKELETLSAKLIPS